MSAELRVHYDQMRRQRDDLMRVQLQKERLSAFLVHDLKNPIHAMDLHAQILLRDRSLPEPARESAQHIRASARALNRMVLNLLDISKSEEGKLRAQLADTDVQALGAEIVDELAVRAHEAGALLVLALAVHRVRTDPDLLRRVLENLIENAIRHAPEDTEVRIGNVRCDGDVEWRVSDSGAGVAPELRAKIFEAFVQVENGERVVARAGRGLGLTFCKLAVEALGGTIGVDDAQPGASFWFRLPA
jgi:signal transduction histidine kinase